MQNRIEHSQNLETHHPSSSSSKNCSRMDSSPFSANKDANEDVHATEEVETEIPITTNKRKGELGDSGHTEGEADSKSAKSKKPTPPITRSLVWVHFTRTAENKDKCRCNYCGRILSCPTSSGTTNLGKHLKSCKEHLAWLESKAEKQTVINEEGKEGNLVLGKVSKDVFDEACDELLVLGELPLSFIESLAWKHFCKKVKLYQSHSRKTATRNIYKMYVEKKAKMSKVFDVSNQRVSITTDIWVAPNTGASYMVITAHWIDECWHLRKLIIGFKNISDHKGDSICYVLRECLSDWDIKKIFIITVDNATANTNALKKFKDSFISLGNDALVLGGEFLHMRCCAHILNLVVRDGFNDVDDSISAIRNAVTYIRSSSTRLKSFELRVETGKMSRGSLSLDCKTRWNSTFLMLTRAIQFRLAFDKMEAEDKLYNDWFQELVNGKKRLGPPTVEDWDALEKLVRFLNIFYKSTLVVSSSTTVNSYRCYGEIAMIERNLIGLSNSSSMALREKAYAMKAKFDKYWDGLTEINRLLIVASVFDPRKKMNFASMCFDKLYGKDSLENREIYALVIDVMVRLFDEYSNFSVTPPNVWTSSQSAQTSSQTDKTDGFENLDFEYPGNEYENLDHEYDEMITEKGFDDAKNELEIYLKEKVVNPKMMLGTEYNVLGWWRDNAHKYPVLSKIAKDVLAMQVSSVASESAFSTSERILDPSRSCLTHYTLEVLMCTEQWLKAEIHLSEQKVVTNQQLLADIEMEDALQREFQV